MQTDYDSSKIESIDGASVAVLQACWHQEYTDRLVQVCVEMLGTAQAQTEIHQVPGCYELPLAAKLLAKKKSYDAIVVTGAILKGETDHYQVILETCIRELGKVNYDFEVPIIMELLPVLSIEDLDSRTKGKNNKGIEAALAAISMIRWRRENRL